MMIVTMSGVSWFRVVYKCVVSPSNHLVNELIYVIKCALFCDFRTKYMLNFPWFNLLDKVFNFVVASCDYHLTEPFAYKN